MFSNSLSQAVPFSDPNQHKDLKIFQVVNSGPLIFVPCAIICGKYFKWTVLVLQVQALHIQIRTTSFVRVLQNENNDTWNSIPILKVCSSLWQILAGKFWEIMTQLNSSPQILLQSPANFKRDISGRSGCVHVRGCRTLITFARARDGSFSLRKVVNT